MLSIQSISFSVFYIRKHNYWMDDFWLGSRKRCSLFSGHTYRSRVQTGNFVHKLTALSFSNFFFQTNKIVVYFYWIFSLDELEMHLIILYRYKYDESLSGSMDTVITASSQCDVWWSRTFLSFPPNYPKLYHRAFEYTQSNLYSLHIRNALFRKCANYVKWD